MGQNIANASRVITITPLDGATPGTATYINTQADHLKVGGSPALVDKIQWTVVGCTKGSYAGGTETTKEMTASAQKVKANGKAVMRVGDNGMCAGKLLYLSGSMTCSCRHEIAQAGQIKARAE